MKLSKIVANALYVQNARNTIKELEVNNDTKVNSGTIYEGLKAREAWFKKKGIKLDDLDIESIVKTFKAI